MTTTNIKDKTSKGFFWAIIDNLSYSGLTFIVGLVLARLLSPVEFGILGIIMVFLNLSMTIIDGGFVTALIRKKDADEKDYNTVFYSNLGVAICLTITLILASPFIASFFNIEILKSIIPVISIFLVINSLSIIPKVLLTKQLDFKKQAFSSLISSVTSGTVGICMALNGFGLWSLVWQHLSRQLLMSITLWMFCRWHPALIFSKTSFKSLFGFSSKILAANVINSIYKDMFLVVIGKMFTVKELGYYNRAEQFNLIFSNNLSTVIQRITLPTLSIVQDNIEKFKNTYRKFSMLSAMLTFALVFGLAATAKPLIIILVGEKWLPSVTYLQIMSLYAAIYPLQQLNLNVLNVMKRSDYVLKLEIIKKSLFTLVIVVGLCFNLIAMLWAAVTYYYIEFILNSWYSEKLMSYGTLKQIKDLLPIYITSISVSAIMWTITLTDLPMIVILTLQCIIGIGLYFITYYTTKQKDFLYVLDLIKSKISR